MITRQERPAGVLMRFEDEVVWIDYQIENHPEFLERVADVRRALGEDRGVWREDV